MALSLDWDLEVNATSSYLRCNTLPFLNCIFIPSFLFGFVGRQDRERFVDELSQTSELFERVSSGVTPGDDTLLGLQSIQGFVQA